MDVTLLHNADAGDDDHSGEELRSLVAQAGHDVSYRSLKQPGWEDALADPGDLVVAAGGDGSVAKVFKQIARKDVPVTLLPVGSANNIARTLGLDRDVDALVRGWAGGELLRFDLGIALAPWGDVVFVESVGGGVFGEVLSRAEDVEEAGGVEVEGEEKVDFGLELLREVIEEAPAHEWRVEVDGDEEAWKVLGVEVMNIRELGPNVPFAPDVDTGDGLLDVVLVPESERAALVAYFSERIRELEPTLPDLPRRRGKRVRLRPPDEVRLHVDDRFWPKDPESRGDGAAEAAVGASLSLLVPRR
jgi:diacylglycerol kinase (ATP)